MHSTVIYQIHTHTHTLPLANWKLFLQDLPIPKLSKLHSELLDKPIGTEEIWGVIKSQKLGSILGPSQSALTRNVIFPWPPILLGSSTTSGMEPPWTET